MKGFTGAVAAAAIMFAPAFKAAEAAKIFNAGFKATIARDDWADRIKGKNRKRRYRPRYHDVDRFTRKTRQWGHEYRPGKLFKGHRI